MEIALNGHALHSASGGSPGLRPGPAFGHRAYARCPEALGVAKTRPTEWPGPRAPPTGPPACLEHVPGRPGGQRGVHPRRLAEAGDHDDLHAGVPSRSAACFVMPSIPHNTRSMSTTWGRSRGKPRRPDLSAAAGPPDDDPVDLLLGPEVPARAGSRAAAADRGLSGRYRAPARGLTAGRYGTLCGWSDGGSARTARRCR